MKLHILGLAGAVLMFVAAPAQAQKIYVNGTECTGIVNARFEGATVSFDAQGNIRIDAPGYRVQVIQPGTTAGTATTTTTSTSTSAGTGTPGTGTTTVVYSDTGRAMTTGPASYNPPIVEQTTTTVVTSTQGGSTASTTRPTTGTAATGTTGTTATTSTTTTPRTGTTSPLTKKYFLITQGTGGAAVGETIQVNINGRQIRQVDTSAAQVIDDITDELNLGENTVTLLSTKKPTYTAGASSSTFQVIIGVGHVEHGGQVVIDEPLATYTRSAADATANSRSYTVQAR